MPTVPTYDNFRATPGAGGVTPVQPGYDAQRATGEHLQRTGAALSGLGEAAGRMALDMQDQINQTRVKDAVDQARRTVQNLTFDPQIGFKSQMGFAALQRESGQALPEEYGEKLRSAFSGITAGLHNDQQRRMFQQTAGSISTSFHGDVQGHMLGEFKNYRASTNSGTIDLASDDAKRSWNDPTKISAALDAAKAAVVDNGRLFGWSAAQTDAALLVTTSKVHQTVVMSALENNNPTYALGYRDRYKGQMSADDILRVQGHIDQSVWAGQAMGAVQAATVQMTPRIAPTDFDRLVQITAQKESSGQDFKPDGTLLEGPMIPGQGTAKGRMQVMDATAANPGHGIAPARTDGTPQQIADDRARVGAQLLGALVKKYGDPAKAWAAYNAGAGNVDKAIADSARDAQTGAYRGAAGQPATDWLDKLAKYQSPENHKQTVDYVTSNVAALGSGGGQVMRPTELDFVNAAVAQLPPGSPPQVVKLTRASAEQQFALVDKARKDQEDRAVANAMQVGDQVGWRFSALPSAVRASIPPKEVDNVMAYYQKRFKGDDVTNPAVYQKLSDQAVLRGLSEDQMYALKRELSEADFKHFAKERGNLVSGKPGQEPGNANNEAIKTAVDENLRAARLDPTPKDDGGSAAARVGAIRKFVNDEVLRAQALAGKKFNEAEVRTKVGEIFIRQRTVEHWFSKDTAAQMLTMNVGDIPSKVTDRLKADFAARGIASPTDAQLLGAYWTAKSRVDDAKRAQR